MTGLLTHLLGHPGRKASKGVQIEEKKSRIRETKNLSTNADSRTDTILKELRDFCFLFFLDVARANERP